MSGLWAGLENWIHPNCHKCRTETKSACYFAKFASLACWGVFPGVSRGQKLGAYLSLLNMHVTFDLHWLEEKLGRTPQQATETTLANRLNKACLASALHWRIFNVERYVGWGCMLNCFMLSSLPFFYAFCWSAIPTSHYIFNGKHQRYTYMYSTDLSCSTVCTLSTTGMLNIIIQTDLSDLFPLFCILKFNPGNH